MSSQFAADLFLLCAIAGYWLSNVLGIVLMQIRRLRYGTTISRTLS
ncbi:hypothetical protein STA3757_36750 [Stanieria sp. NIES-3757]|nr:hypothetical protein STA3757_36750 [Stanieria sp. NIES-3757]